MRDAKSCSEAAFFAVLFSKNADAKSGFVAGRRVAAAVAVALLESEPHADICCARAGGALSLFLERRSFTQCAT